MVVLTTGTSSGAGSGSEVLQRGWNNFAYQGDPLPVGDALNDAAPVVESVWGWDPNTQGWKSWLRDAPPFLNTLQTLVPERSVWVLASGDGVWTFIGCDGGGDGDGEVTLVEGPPGADGLNCWDLNGNGQFDPATEDANGDGRADARDCRGPAGTATLPPGAVIGLAVVQSLPTFTIAFSVGDQIEATASCGIGQIAVGGGGSTSGSNTTMALVQSEPVGDPPRAWTVTAEVLSTTGFLTNASVIASVVCADVVP